MALLLSGVLTKSDFQTDNQLFDFVEKIIEETTRLAIKNSIWWSGLQFTQIEREVMVGMNWLVYIDNEESDRVDYSFWFGVPDSVGWRMFRNPNTRCIASNILENRQSYCFIQYFSQ
nr:gamma protein [Yata virus]